MGNDCCRKDIEPEIHSIAGPESTQALSPEECLSEKATPLKKGSKLSPDRSAIEESLEKFVQYTSIIKKMQARFRGKLSRKANPLPSAPLSLMIIKYVREQLKDVTSEENLNVDPFIVNWDAAEYRKNLKLKKAITDESNNTYAGYWNKTTNKKEGYGQERFADGGQYEGFWKDDEFDGEGRYIHENGDSYAGSWKQGRAHGFGTFVGFDGIKYIGEWKEDEHHGKGIEIFK